MRRAELVDDGVAVRKRGPRVRDSLRLAGAGLLLSGRVPDRRGCSRDLRAVGLVLPGRLGPPVAVPVRTRLRRTGNGRWAPVSEDLPESWSPDAARRAHVERTAARALEALYRQADAAWSGFRCPGTAECCQLAARGREPWLWGVEWDALRRAVPELPSPRADGGCPFLDAAGKRCTAYAARPLGCRTYFCHRAVGPAREPVEEMDRLQRRLETIAHSVRPDEAGPRPITAWIEESAR